MQSIHQQYLHSKDFNMLVIKSRALSHLEETYIILRNEITDSITKRKQHKVENLLSKKFKEER